MSTHTALATQDLFDSYLGERPEDESGVRHLYAFIAFDVGPSDEPSPVYASYRGSHERFYLGTSFETGIIPAADWADAMRAGGAPSWVVEEVARWLSDRVI